MGWTLEFDAAARKQLRKLPRDVGERIFAALEQIAGQDDPRQRGTAMVGDRSGHWRYRIGDYRIIARIEDARLVIVVIAVGHRREIYR
ncbi:MAG: type II toxin-antitoxin system RelE/ParE family toxin [Sphingomonas sp.]|uniref:type II toxin-antitoxin system RelE family toxin n=1 Tax=Sphingomonas sp. TaxID=28214 RepID=UPI0026156F8F|nr:type II toxin-antitoxin system RelE/ParE family toxin [Sphingomonas sp.]MDK2770461.1 type II toxin-antitoxin system RelE/ParE family toxin [Sphingomonas sp.]